MKTIKELIDMIRPSMCNDCETEYRIKYETGDYICFECQCRKSKCLDLDNEIKDMFNTGE